MLVDMKELPADIPLDVNPREPKMTTNAAHSLLAAVVEPETDFYINNRGIVIAAKALTFNSADSEVTVDIDKYPDDNAAPVQSYSGKAQVFKRYKQAFETPFYKSLTKQIPTLIELYYRIERELPEKYKEYKRAQGIANPRFGSVRGIEALDNPTKTEFLANPTKYSVSSGYIYPIFGAFRSLLRFDEAEGEVSWLFDPMDIWNEVGTSIVQNTFETYTNPQLAGKDKQLWLSNYRIAETQSLRKLLAHR